MKITIKMLKKMPSGQKACKRARKWFKENWPKSNYPDGIDFWTVWEACQRLDWQVWFTQHSGILLDEFCWKCAGQTFRYAAILSPELAIYADNVTAENWQEAAAAATSNAAAYAAAYAAFYAAAFYAVFYTTASCATDAANDDIAAEQRQWLTDLWVARFIADNDTAADG